MTSYITGFAGHYFKGGARVLFFSDWGYVSRKRLRTADVEYFHFYFSQICQRNCLSSLYSYFHFSENAKREKEKKNKFRIFLQNLEFFLCSKYFKFCLRLVHNWKQNRGGYCFLSCLKRFFFYHIWFMHTSSSLGGAGIRTHDWGITSLDSFT